MQCRLLFSLKEIIFESIVLDRYMHREIYRYTGIERIQYIKTFYESIKMIQNEQTTWADILKARNNTASKHMEIILITINSEM